MSQHTLKCEAPIQFLIFHSLLNKKKHILMVLIDKLFLPVKVVPYGGVLSSGAMASPHTRLIVQELKCLK